LSSPVFSMRMAAAVSSSLVVSYIHSPAEFSMFLRKARIVLGLLRMASTACMVKRVTMPWSSPAASLFRSASRSSAFSWLSRSSRKMFVSMRIDPSSPGLRAGVLRWFSGF